MKVNNYQVFGVVFIAFASFMLLSVYFPSYGTGQFTNEYVGVASPPDSPCESCGPPDGCENDEDCAPGWGCFIEPTGYGVCQSAYGGNPSGQCSTNAECGGCQDCDTSIGECYWRCPSSECHFHPSGTSGSCPGEPGY